VTAGRCPSRDEIIKRTKEVCDAHARRFPAVPPAVFANLRTSDSLRAVVRCWMMDCPERRAFDRVARYAMLGLIALARHGGESVPKPDRVDRSKTRRVTKNAMTLRRTLRDMRAVSGAYPPSWTRRWTASLLRAQEGHARRIHGKAGPFYPGPVAVRELWPRLHIDTARLDDHRYLPSVQLVVSGLLADIGIEMNPKNVKQKIRALPPPTIDLRREPTIPIGRCNN